MSISTQYLGQGITGSLGKYQIDATSLEQLGFLKTGSVLRSNSSLTAINLSSNWSGFRNINSKTDFLINTSEQETAILEIFEKNFQTYFLQTGLTSTLTQNQLLGLLIVSFMSGANSVTSLMLNINEIPVTISNNLLINQVDLLEQSIETEIVPSLTKFFSITQIQALVSQTAKITSKLPVSIPGPLSNIVSPAGALGGSIGKLPGLSSLPGGGLGALTAGTGGLTNSLGGAAGALNKLPGGLSVVPGNLNNFAGKIPPGVTSKTGGILNSLNKVSNVAGTLPGKLNDLAGTVPSSLAKIAGKAAPNLSLIELYQAGVHASELGKKLANG